MNHLAIIQARCSSERLPNKVMMPLCGVPVLTRVINGVLHCDLVDDIVVATGLAKENLPIVSLAADNNTLVYCGSENDVLERFYQAAALLKPKFIVRITADCPLFDGLLLKEALTEMKPDTDYLCMQSETFPDGLDLEVFTFEALEKAHKNAKLSSEREHVTLYIRNHPEMFNIQDFVCKNGNFGSFRLTLDEKEDFELLQKVCEHFEGQSYRYYDVIKYLQNHPEIACINSHIARNEGLAKSLEKEKGN